MSWMHFIYFFLPVLSMITIGTSAMSLPFTTIESGAYSGIEDPVTQVFLGANEFGNFWAKHGSNESPSVDFSTNMVICVFTGTKNTGGFSVDITRVEDSGDEILVTYETRAPSPGGMVTMALTQPHHIIQTAKSSKKVTFEAQAVQPEAPPLTFVLTFNDKSQMNDIVDKIEAMDTVESVNKLSGLGIALVTFVSDTLDEGNAMALLSGIEGIATVEKDQ
uniref:PrcB C-terminal domain-containing protein n=1 Tax=Attheya septentrionalis TaxID=420275 RepID=A0A7S2UQQ1_9STRA|mmetsp:Transcript_8614/g.15628  ORF Transcript_8614/g.15628 Transcript_8614/m.15628 type:complete len:220 (+) Transcript_8614:94-753(+)